MRADFEKGTKVCSMCKRELPISEFYKNKCNKDELHNQCKDCKKESAKKYMKTQKGKEQSKRAMDKMYNTFGRTGHKRGCSVILKRDYELTEEQLQRKNNTRKSRGKCKSDKKQGVYGILIWYSGLLNDLSVGEYKKILTREYSRQRMCAIRGYIGRVKPSEHFLFDFDLEQMLKDNVCYGNGKYIYKWWKGEIRHWTVNDGVWKDGK